MLCLDCSYVTCRLCGQERDERGLNIAWLCPQCAEGRCAVCGNPSADLLDDNVCMSCAEAITEPQSNGAPDGQ